jgi:hypothetical protein
LFNIFLNSMGKRSLEYASPVRRGQGPGQENGPSVQKLSSGRPIYAGTEALSSNDT